MILEFYFSRWASWKKKKKKKKILPIPFCLKTKQTKQKNKKNCTKPKVPHIFCSTLSLVSAFLVESHHLISSSRHFITLNKRQSGKCLMLWLLWAGQLAPGPSLLSPGGEETKWWTHGVLQTYQAGSVNHSKKGVHSVNSTKTGTTLVESQCLAWQLMPRLWNVPGLPPVASHTSPLYHGPLAPWQPQQEHRSASFPAQVLKRGQGWQSGKAMAVSLFGAASKSDVSASLPPSSAMQRANGASIPWEEDEEFGCVNPFATNKKPKSSATIPWKIKVRKAAHI